MALIGNPVCIRLCMDGKRIPHECPAKANAADAPDRLSYMDAGKITDEELDLWEEDFRLIILERIMESRRDDLMELSKKR